MIFVATVVLPLPVPPAIPITTGRMPDMLARFSGSVTAPASCRGPFPRAQGAAAARKWACAAPNARASAGAALVRARRHSPECARGHPQPFDRDVEHGRAVARVAAGAVDAGHPRRETV